jgi:hypothetical protein
MNIQTGLASLAAYLDALNLFAQVTVGRSPASTTTTGQQYPYCRIYPTKWTERETGGSDGPKPWRVRTVTYAVEVASRIASPVDELDLEALADAVAQAVQDVDLGTDTDATVPALSSIDEADFLTTRSAATNPELTILLRGSFSYLVGPVLTTDETQTPIGFFSAEYFASSYFASSFYRGPTQ